MSGRLIAIEGGEGAGKSTQALLLAEAIGAELTREPGGTPLGESVRALLLDGGERLEPRTELFLALAARSEHLARRILPALSSGRHVVVDRFSGSTLAYQGYGRGLDLDEVRVAARIASAGTIPDLSVLLDLPVRVAASRRSRAKDRIEVESDAFHEAVRAGFLAEAAADPRHWTVVDATAPLEAVSRAVLEAVTSALSIERVGGP